MREEENEYRKIRNEDEEEGEGGEILMRERKRMNIGQ